jgi:hypothetical protein
MIRSFVVAIALAISPVLLSQEVENEKPPLSQRLFFGGSFGLQLGTVTNIQIAPVGGVWLLPRLNIAAGPSFQYYHYDNFSTAIYGGRTYSQFMFLQDLNNVIPLGVHLGFYLQGEYEGLSLERSVFVSDTATGRVYQGTWLGGIGISEPVGPRSAIDVEFMWTLSGDKYQVHESPEFRVMLMF